MTDTQFAKLRDGLSEAKAALGKITLEWLSTLNDAEFEYVATTTLEFLDAMKIVSKPSRPTAESLINDGRRSQGRRHRAPSRMVVPSGRAEACSLPQCREWPLSDLGLGPARTLL